MKCVYYVYILFDAFCVPRYVGKGKGNRWLDHERYSDPVNWMKNEFIERTWILLDEVPKIKVRENISETEAFLTETTLIKAIGRFPDGPLTNMTDGGEGPSGVIPSKSHREAISYALTGRVRSPEHSAAISRARTGYKMSEEQKKKISQKLTGRPFKPSHLEAVIAACHARKGKPNLLSPEHRAAVICANQARRGEKRSTETRAKISAFQRGRPDFLTPEGRAAIVASNQRRRIH